MTTSPLKLEDVEGRWRALTESERTVARNVMADAWMLLLGRDATIEARLADATLAPERVRFVLSSMVLRVLKNPDGKRQESVDDYSYTRDQSLSAGALYVSNDELALLAAPTTSGRSRRSVRLVAYGDGL